MAGKTKSTKRALRPATQLVHGGTLRSEFGETSEAIFMTQSYVYDTAEQAERRFKGEEPGFIYSRYANPTVAMFEERMRLLEGAEAARSTASGMAAVTAVFLSWLSSGDHVVAASFDGKPVERHVNVVAGSLEHVLLEAPRERPAPSPDASPVSSTRSSPASRSGPPTAAPRSSRSPTVSSSTRPSIRIGTTLRRAIACSRLMVGA